MSEAYRRERKLKRLVVADWPIVYPSPETMLSYKQKVGDHLRKHFDVKTYASPHEINNIIKCVVGFFESEIDERDSSGLCIRRYDVPLVAIVV